MLSNDSLCLRTAAHYVLLFSVLVVNFAQFQVLHTLTLAVHSYALLIKYIHVEYVSANMFQPT